MDVSVTLVKHLLQSVVHLRAVVPRQHPSTRILGDERFGSGVVVDPAGLILTVNYVVMGAQTVDVSFLKGRRTRAEIVAQDFEVGLALLRVRRQGLPAAALGHGAALERGQAVIALASVGAAERRVAGGLVTYLGEFEAYWEYLLDHGVVSSAPNPGLGGGGLFTPAGAMVGVVSLDLNGITRSSLSISIDCYTEHAEELLRYGRVASRPRRAWLGVFAHALDEGVVIAGVVPEGPGDVGGLQEGDVILSLNAEDVPNRRELYLSLWRHEPGEPLTLEVMRDNKMRRCEVKGGDRAHFFRRL